MYSDITALIRMTLERGEIPDLHGLESSITPPSPPKLTQERKRELHEIQTITTTLGRHCEHAAFATWSGGIPTVKDGTLEGAILNIQLALQPVTEKTMNSKEADGFYQKLYTPVGVPTSYLDNLRSPLHPALKLLFDVSDQTFGTSLHLLLQQLPETWEGKIDPRFRYLVEAALIMTKLHTGIEPSPFTKSSLLANKTVTVNGSGNLAQHDGIIIPSSLNECDIPFSMADYWHTRHPYAIIETKTVFKAKHTGPNKLRRPRVSDIKDQQIKIGKIISAISTNGSRDSCLRSDTLPFTFPHHIVFVYLRGLQPNIYHRVNFDEDLIETWHQGLAKRLMEDKFAPGEYEQVALMHTVLVNERRRQEKVRRQQYDEEISGLKSIREFEQKTLI